MKDGLRDLCPVSDSVQSPTTPGFQLLDVCKLSAPGVGSVNGFKFVKAIAANMNGVQIWLVSESWKPSFHPPFATDMSMRYLWGWQKYRGIHLETI